MAIDARKHEGRVAVDLVIALEEGEAPVQVVVTPHGLQVRRKGRRTALGASWDKLLRRMDPPLSAPAKYLARPERLILDG